MFTFYLSFLECLRAFWIFKGPKQKRNEALKALPFGACKLLAKLTILENFLRIAHLSLRFSVNSFSEPKFPHKDPKALLLALSGKLYLLESWFTFKS
jgi:hypothetical protein